MSHGESGSSSTAEHAKQEVKQAAEQAKTRAEEEISHAEARAEGRAKQELGRRSSQVGEQTRSIGQALHKAGDDLRSKGKQREAKAVDEAAHRLERLGERLSSKSGDRLVHDAEEFARRHAGLLAGTAFALGLLGGRVLKASTGSEGGEEQPHQRHAEWRERELGERVPPGRLPAEAYDDAYATAGAPSEVRSATPYRPGGGRAA